MTKAHEFQDHVLQGKDVKDIVDNHLDTTFTEYPWSAWIFDDGSLLIGRDPDEGPGKAPFTLTAYKVDGRN